jgi:methyl-accepting chemotaxis protein-3 (ribose and galactose sensor receptor)
MSLKKSSLIVLFSLLFFFVVSTVTSVGLIIKSNNSLDNVNKEIQVVLSIIDPINHSRTLRVRVMEYVKMVEAGNSADGAAKLDRRERGADQSGPRLCGLYGFAASDG